MGCFYLKSQAFQEDTQFLTFNLAVRAGSHFSKSNIHNSGALQIADLLKESDAHSSDLMLLALGQNNSKSKIV